MALKRRLTFDELVQENRRQIITDRTLMGQIEEKLEEKRRVYREKAE